MKRLFMLMLVSVLGAGLLAASATASPRKNKKAKAADAGAAADTSADAKAQKKDGGPVMDDAKIESDVNAKIAAMPSLANAGIKAESKNGQVTLTGSVANFAQKGVATKAAHKVAGVKGVNNQITVAAGAEKPGKHKGAAEKKSKS